MQHQPLELTYEVDLAPGEKLALADSLLNSVGPGRWIITVQALRPGSQFRDHSAFLRSYALA
jgi:hypothetical protein